MSLISRIESPQAKAQRQYREAQQAEAQAKVPVMRAAIEAMILEASSTKTTQTRASELLGPDGRIAKAKRVLRSWEDLL